MPARQAFQAIVYVLRTKIQWNALPRRFGSSSAVHARFKYWEKNGFFHAIWQTGLAEHDGLEGISWEWQSADNAIVKKPLTDGCAGRNPTSRGKKSEPTQPAQQRIWRPARNRRIRQQGQ